MLRVLIEKIFTEKPDEPSIPRPSEKAVLERLRLTIPSESTARPKTFEICFPQPMSDYLKFKVKIIFFLKNINIF